MKQQKSKTKQKKSVKSFFGERYIKYEEFILLLPGLSAASSSSTSIEVAATSALSVEVVFPVMPAALAAAEVIFEKLSSTNLISSHFLS